MQNARRTAICLTLLFLVAPMMPLATASNPESELKIDLEQPTFDSIEDSIKSIDALPLKSLELLTPKATSTSGRAACPSPSTLQSDGGSSGDAGADANTSRSLGTNPNSGTTGVQGCVDATDTDDWYTVTTTAGKDVDVELVVPSGADFDLYLVDSSGGEYDHDWSEYNDPLEKVSTTGTSFSGVPQHSTSTSEPTAEMASIRCERGPTTPRHVLIWSLPRSLSRQLPKLETL